MHRNAATKLNNEEASLPDLNNLNITNNCNIDNNKSTADTLQQQITTQLLQQNTLANFTNITQTTSTADTITTTKDNLQLAHSQANNSVHFNTIVCRNYVSQAKAALNEIQPTASTAPLATTTTTPTLRTSTLYPTVIETLDNNTSTITATTTSSAATQTNTLVSANDKIASGAVNAAATNLINNQKALVNNQRKQSKKSFQIKITAARENSRLATLRKRKHQISPLPVVVSESKKKAQSGENLLQLNSVNSSESTTTSAITTVLHYLDESLLNKIEPLECEVSQKRGYKRKRINSVVSSANTRKRASKQKNSTASLAVASSAASEQKQIAATAAAANTATNTTSNCKKQPLYTMSLYERRYQNDDGGRGVVSNGYLSSTRNSSAGSAGVAETNVNAADTQDISSQQYYMSASSGSAALALNNGSAAGSATVVANHAPSMATLCNIGNTCYLNSVVYTLRFAPHFLHNLHHLIVDLSTIQQNIVRHRAKSSSLGRGMSAAHMENARSWSNKDLASLEQYNGVVGGNATAVNGAKTTHQLLTEKLHELYQSLHRNEVTESTEPYHADTLLHAIQDVSAIFEGNQQQDAHEFLMCMLNSIRETCQTLLKAIADCPDVIWNSYIANPDEVDASHAIERDACTSANSNTPISGNGTSSSSLSTSNITKASFFSRKSKRKEEAKNSKNVTRLQSPLKDGSGAHNAAMPNSLFYLNTVDLSGSGTNASNASSAVSVAPIKGVADGSSPVSLLKDKERLAEKIRELGLDFFTEDFEGVTVATTKCLSCETITEQKERMIDIAVPVPISGYDSADYAEKPSSFIQNSCITREYFRCENKYRCEQCTGYTEAIRSISYEVLPRLLVIQLSRFSGGMEKINSYIPTSFTLQCFCAKCCELSDANKLHIYKLYSVITHVGATMSVGHYIAYTCSLDWSSEYVNCPKDRQRTSSSSSSILSQQQQQTQQQQNGLQNNGSQQSSAASAAASALASGSNLMKKMKFGRSKASSSGDMSKNVKQLNGITSKTITNGLGKLSMNTTCHSLDCCATRLCAGAQHQQLHSNNSDLGEESLQNGSSSSTASTTNHSASSSSGGGGVGAYNNFPSGYGSTGRGGAKNLYNLNSAPAVPASSLSSSAEPIWYMCDDDKIKAMSQREFEELLSPARKITITPYLLFYARFDLQPLQPSPPKSQASTSTATTTTSPAQSVATAWSNESQHSGLHKI